MSDITLVQRIAHFDAYFRSANGVPPNARISVPTAEWQELHAELTAADEIHMRELTAYRTTVQNQEAELSALRARCAEMEGKARAVSTIETEYASCLAQCRDAFPVPATNTELEGLWVSAIGCPLSVPDYIRAIAEQAPQAALASVPVQAAEPVETVRYWLKAYSSPESGEHFQGHGMVVKLLHDYLALLAATPEAGVPAAAPDARDAESRTLVEILAANWAVWPAGNAVEQTCLGNVFCSTKGRNLMFGTHQIAVDQDKAVVTRDQWCAARAAIAAQAGKGV